MLQFWLAAVYSAAALVSAVSADDSYDAQAKAIVDTFSHAQLIGQMTQINIGAVIDSETGGLNETAVRENAELFVGSYLNTDWSEPYEGKYGYNASEFREMIGRIQNITMSVTGGQPIIYGLDSVHGANYVDGSVLTPQQINAGASFNPDLLYEAGRMTARDTLAAGIPWIFGPILDISQNKLWARTYETYGESTYLSTVMGVALIRGIQSQNQTAACAKHFIGYSKTATGHDRTNVLISDFELLNNFMPPHLAAINDANVLTIMENYISLNNEPVIANKKILIDLLRGDLKFNGALVSDYNEVMNLNMWHRVADDYEDATISSLTQTSLDLSMMDGTTTMPGTSVVNEISFINAGLKLLKEQPDQEARIRQSVERIIKTKLKLGLYKNPLPGAELVSMVGNEKDKELALEMARESIVLLQNDDNVLPLSKKSSVFLTGPSADDVGYQCGGWTKFWQGVSGNDMFPHGISIRKGLGNLVGSDSFSYFNGLLINGSISNANLTKTVDLAGRHEYTIAAIGEQTYAEKPGDIDNLALPKGFEEFIEALAATGTKVIVVLLEGRPRLLGSIPDNAVAVIDAMLPCELGGQAIAEILYGDVNPSGKLPISYPKDPANVDIPYNHLVTTRCAFDYCEMQWDFGTGLSYTNFSYSNVTLDKTSITNVHDTLTATVTVTNEGSRAGKEVVMLFLIQPIRRISVPEMKNLKKFEKIELKAGESKKVSFTLSYDDWSVYKGEIGAGLPKIVESTKYVVGIGADTDCNVYGDPSIKNGLCAHFTIDASGAPAM
ncbi:unnamed protein product [Peronospora farinosa]|uniref:beta-glucosidase n=1 Tax=Peronospora farinosa TaxID=134698 RepID=A0AAV0UMG5_9STRA|nr:unnamed protein product [Peronospora farinosa]CAI5737378.1 unnamed protein product [Peronospora farinosa]